jgi:hypothetical protein
MANQPDHNEPQSGQLIAPVGIPPPPIDVGSKARERARATPTDRIEARADLQISELKGDKESLRSELRVVRYTEIPHLRDDVRWLEDRISSLRDELNILRTSYGWAISFSWFSFALVAIGGGLVSYASFLMDMRTTVATLAMVALLIGVLIQAVVSYLGTRTLIKLPRVGNTPERPLPCPPESQTHTEAVSGPPRGIPNADG